MKGIDKYIFVFLLIASLTMILASCKQTNTEETTVSSPASTTEAEKTYTSEGTISTGTTDTMNDHTNKSEAERMNSANTEVPIKGETTPKN